MQHCEKCDGTGLIIHQGQGYTTVMVCQCRQPDRPFECPDCHGDPATAEIAQRMGHRPDVAFARVQEVERQNAELVEALKPFAENADNINADDDDEDQPDWSPFIKVGHYRRADKALKAAGSDHD